MKVNCYLYEARAWECNLYHLPDAFQLLKGHQYSKIFRHCCGTMPSNSPSSPLGLGHPTRGYFLGRSQIKDFCFFSFHCPLHIDEAHHSSFFLRLFSLYFSQKNVHFSHPKDIRENSRILYHYIFIATNHTNSLCMRNWYSLPLLWWDVC